MMQNLSENILNPIIVNVISPLVLFVLAYLFLKIDWIKSIVNHVFNTVKESMILNNDTEIADSPKPKTTKEQHKDNGKNTITKMSKNHGSDKGWKIRTFYTVPKNQIKDNDSIIFKMRERDDLKIEIKTNWLIDQFGLDEPNEEISDDAGKIRIYIFQEKGGNKEFYLVRFGRKALKNPEKLTEKNSIIVQ